MTIWDERFAAEDYVYGKEPNDFLASVINKLPKGQTLSLAGGEGINCVFLAQHGMNVHSVDSSQVGLAKAQ